MCTNLSYRTQLFPPFTFPCKQAQSDRSLPRSHNPACQPMLSSSSPVTGTVIPIHFYLMPYSSPLHSPPHTLHTLLLTLAQPCGLYSPPGSFFLSFLLLPSLYIFSHFSTSTFISFSLADSLSQYLPQRYKHIC